MEATVGTEDNEWVSVMGEGIQIKKIVAGSGDIAEMNTIVSCNLTGYFGDDTDHEYPFENLQDQVFIIGEMDTIPSIELTLRYKIASSIIVICICLSFNEGQKRSFHVLFSSFLFLDMPVLEINIGYEALLNLLLDLSDGLVFLVNLYENLREKKVVAWSLTNQLQ